MATTADINRKRLGTALAVRAIPLAASQHAYAGQIIVKSTLDGYGYVRAAGAILATDQIAGVAEYEVDNSSGSDGDLSVPCAWGQIIELDNSSANAVDLADKDCYVEDDVHVRDYVAGGVNVRAGSVMQRSAAKVWVMVGIPAADISVDDLTVVDDLEVGDDLTVGDDANITGDVTCANLDPTGDISLDTGKKITSAAEVNIEAPADSDLNLTCAAGTGDMVAKLADAAGAQKLSVVDSAAAEVASIDSDGKGTFSGGVDCNDFVETDQTALTTGGVPTQANMVTAFGAAADHAGELRMLYDDTPGNCYRCYSDGTSWYCSTFTLGV